MSHPTCAICGREADGRDKNASADWRGEARY